MNAFGPADDDAHALALPRLALLAEPPGEISVEVVHEALEEPGLCCVRNAFTSAKKRPPARREARTARGRPGVNTSSKRSCSRLCPSFNRCTGTQCVCP